MKGKELVETFALLFDEVSPTTPEEIDAELRTAGYDPEVIGEKFRRIADWALQRAIVKDGE